MSKLFELVPLPYRWLAMAALVAAFAGYFYLKGYAARDESADLAEAKVQVLADDAARRAGAAKAAQDKNTKEIRDAHAKDVAAIRAYYARRLRDAAAGSGGVPAPADSARGSDGATGECRPGDEGDVALILLEERAALDAEKVLKLQDFLRENGFPVR